MLKIKSGDIVQTYTLKEDDADPKTVFKYRLPTLAAQQNLYSDVNLADGGTDFKLSPKQLDDLLMDAIVEIENIEIDGKLETINFLNMAEPIKRRADIIRDLGVNVRMEVAGEIVSQMNASEDLEKN